jgi:hypothetical protein
MFRFLVLLLVIIALSVSVAESQQPKKANPPKFEAVAETKLIMEGMIQPNFRGVEKLLRGTPKDLDSWTFARGQSLLIAEAGNLLQLRPPREKGQELWSALAIQLRESSTRLARFNSEKELLRARTALVEITAVCNRCHEAFGVKHNVKVFGEE